MIKIYVSFLLISSIQCLNAQSSDSPEKLSLFLEVSTNLNERDMAISPDGKEMYYTLSGNQNAFSTIIHRKRLPNNKWSNPEVASFSGKYKDLEAAFSQDGNKLFFSSNRPISGNKVKDYDIWVVEKVNGTWSAPKNLGKPINTEANEFYPSVTNSGNLYYTAEYDRGVGKEDIYVSRWVNGSFTESIPLDTAVNSTVWEFNAFVSPDETFIIFTSYGRKDDQGGGDLYISTRNADGHWQPAKNLSVVNSSKLDYCPFVPVGRKTLFFTSARHTLPPSYEQPVTYEELLKSYNGISNGSENIYWISFANVLKSLK